MFTSDFYFLLSVYLQMIIRYISPYYLAICELLKIFHELLTLLLVLM
jgi:hypothetical protein